MFRYLLLAHARAHAFSISFRFSLIKRKSFWLYELSHHKKSSLFLSQRKHTKQRQLNWKAEFASTDVTSSLASTQTRLPPPITEKRINKPSALPEIQSRAFVPANVCVLSTIDWRKLFCFIRKNRSFVCVVKHQLGDVGGVSRWGTKISFIRGRGARAERRKNERNIYKSEENCFLSFNRFLDACSATWTLFIAQKEIKLN